MIGLILGIILLFACSITALITVIPVFLHCTFEAGGTSRLLDFEFSWIHPRIFRVCREQPGEKLQLVLFQRFYPGKRKLVRHNSPVSPDSFASGKGRQPDHRFFDGALPPPRPPEQPVSSNDAPEEILSVMPVQKAKSFDPQTIAGPTAESKTTKPKISPESPSQQQSPHSTKKGLPARIRSSTWFFFLRQKPWLRRIFHWILHILHSLFHLIAWDSLTFHAYIGLREHPEITGFLSGPLFALRNAFVLEQTQHPHFNLSIEPDFQRSTLSCNGEISVHTSLLRLLMPVCIALLYFPYFSSFMVWRRYRHFQRSHSRVP